MEFKNALSLADAFVRAFGDEAGIDLQIDVDKTVCGRIGWAFFYNSADFIRRGNVSDALVGNGPIIVYADGRVENFPAFVPVEDVFQLIEAQGP